MIVIFYVFETGAFIFPWGTFRPPARTPYAARQHGTNIRLLFCLN